jgi:hypothetical protein
MSIVMEVRHSTACVPCTRVENMRLTRGPLAMIYQVPCGCAEHSSNRKKAGHATPFKGQHWLRYV